MPTHSLTPLFYRRMDLTSQVRMRIATMVLYFSSPGLVLRLSNKYSVTPQFIYNLRTELAELAEKNFGTKSKELSQLAPYLSQTNSQIYPLAPCLP